MSYTIQELEAQLSSLIDQRAKIDLISGFAWDIRLDDPDQSRKLSEQAHELATSGEFASEPYLPGVIGSLRNFAFLNNDIGNYALALTDSLQALDLLGHLPVEEKKTQLMMIDVLANIGWSYRCYGDYGIAAEYNIKALRLAQEAEDGLRQARLLNSLSNVYAESNDPDASLDMGYRALQYYHELGFVDGESVVLNNLALTYLQMGNGAKALETGHESLRLAHEHAVAAVELTALSSLGEIYLGIKDYVQAEVYLLRALTLARARGARNDEFLDLLNLGKVYQAQQDEQKALSTYQEALGIAQELQQRPGEFQCHELLAEVYEKRGEVQVAFQHFRQFHALKETVFNENAAKRLSGLQVIHQVETAKRDAEIHYLKTIELKKEIEERKTAQAALEKLAGVDPLTGLLNRREFFILAEDAVQRALQNGQSLTAILFDLDHFKRINDTYGHAAGDQALIQTAKRVRESLCQDELLGRYGGDEFVILLPGSNGVRGKQVAERLREKMASQTIATSRGNCSLTLSLGIAELQAASGANLDTLLDLADQALYVAKRSGRNQLAIYADPLSHDSHRSV